MTADYAPERPRHDQEADVIALGHPPAPEARPSPPSRWHAFAISGMAISALVGIAAMLAFITVTWPDNLRAVLVGVFVLSGVSFLTFSSVAILTAALDTYPRRTSDPTRDASH